MTLAGPVTPTDAFKLIAVYTPVASAGIVSFDGKGNLHGVDVINFGWGGIPRTYTGTYAVVDAKAEQLVCHADYTRWMGRAWLLSAGESISCRDRVPNN